MERWKASKNEKQNIDCTEYLKPALDGWFPFLVVFTARQGLSSRDFPGFPDLKDHTQRVFFVPVSKDGLEREGRFVWFGEEAGLALKREDSEPE